ncbi:MAG: type II toxin-antitoxin system VapC family toxin [Thiobacillaceae bacterium]|nr:type II toxin-antitoxin system VapC family toxin [Thiobacillaceae bacterium]
MKLLLDTQVLLWAAGMPESLSPAAQQMIADSDHELCYSVASLWEIVIKNGLGRSDFLVDARLLRRGLLDHGYRELPVSAEHVLAVGSLPAIHRDPFDRLLVAQAMVEGIALVTRDARLAQYPAPIVQI